MKYTKTVVCLKDYVEDCSTFWNTGETYRVIRHNDNTWSIETNFRSEGKVGEGIC